MRHLARLYFDNPPQEDAVLRYVAMFDQGADGAGNPRFNFVNGTLVSAGDLANALNFLIQAACFFKLPVGASAIVDVYVPDGLQERTAKTFDYQVFKSCIPLDAAKAKLSSKASEILSMVTTAAGEGSAAQPPGPAGPAGPGTGPGGTISVCSLFSPGGCNGQTEVQCPDAINLVATCVNGNLECVAFKPSKDGE